MAGGKYSLVPQVVPPVKSRYRRIRTRLPVPESIPIFEALEKSEPRSMMGQPPVIWHRAEGFQIWDPWGNTWIDWSSGVLITNAGHGRREIRSAIHEVLDRSLLSSYVFAHAQRAELTGLLQSLAPDPEGYRVFLLTTGSEAVENAIKLAKTYAIEKHGRSKKYLVSFDNAFHGRTMGSQLAGGMPKGKAWIVDEGSTFVQVPFPDGYKNENTSFDLFLSTLAQKGVQPKEVAGVLTESFQGVGPDFLPVEYAQKLQEFCRVNDAVTIFDEVQAGFGRSGRMFTFEHYGVKPDLIVCGKGISSSLPIAAVIGRSDIMDLYPPGSMTSTHSASPLPVAAALANIKLLLREKLAERAAVLGDRLQPRLAGIQGKHRQALGCLHGKGLVAGLQVVRPGTKTPDPDTALRINELCFQKGLLMFAPVGVAGECLKICPPLVIAEDALDESIDVFAEACDQVLGQ